MAKYIIRKSYVCPHPKHVELARLKGATRMRDHEVICGTCYHELDPEEKAKVFQLAFGYSAIVFRRGRIATYLAQRYGGETL